MKVVNTKYLPPKGNRNIDSCEEVVVVVLSTSNSFFLFLSMSA